MYILKGFNRILPLINNAPTVVAPLGELGPLGFTFAKEKTYHSLADKPAVELISFTSTSNGLITTPSDDYVSTVLTMLDWIYTTAVAGNFDSEQLTFQQHFLTEFGVDISLLEIGRMVSNTRIFLPEYIRIKLENNIVGDNEATIWFSDAAFQSQYNDFEVVFVNNFGRLDDFFDSYQNVNTMVKQIDLTQTLQDAKESSKKYPYTNIRADMFEWVDPTDRNRKIPVYFVLLIYGSGGDNIDAVKEAIITFLLANSTKTREQWAIIFPDLFTSTEMILIPFWKNYAIPNLTPTSGLYSSNTHLDAAPAMALRATRGKGYTDEHILAVGNIISTMYKGIHLVAVGGPDNRDGLNMFSKLFPDYMNVDTKSPDFSRMSPFTRDFILIMVDLLKQSEVMENNTPTGYTRVVRDGIIYLARSYARIQFLMPIKSNNL